jgi:hypothetical protein
MLRFGGTTLPWFETVTGSNSWLHLRLLRVIRVVLWEHLLVGLVRYMASKYGSTSDPHESQWAANWSVADSDLLQAASGGAGTSPSMCVLACSVTRWQRRLSLSWRSREYHPLPSISYSFQQTLVVIAKIFMSDNKTEQQPPSWQVAF